MEEGRKPVRRKIDFSFHHSSENLMKLESYLQKGESQVCSADAYRELQDTTGTLAVTSDRLIFVDRKTALDISLDAIDVIRYEKPHFPLASLLAVLGFLFVGVVGPGLAGDLNQFPLDPGFIRWAGFGIAAAAAGLGLFYRRAHLKVSTPSGDYEFTARGDNLQKFPKTIRKER